MSAVLVALVAVTVAALVGRWAWRLHVWAARALGVGSGGSVGGAAARAQSTMTVGRGATAGEDPSVLVWGRVQLLSVLTDETMAIVACRRPRPAKSRSRARRSPGAGPRVGAGVGPGPGAGGGPGAGRHLCGDDRTIVLHLGGGEAGERALSLLQRWCREGVALKVAPSPLAGTIELADDTGQAALHAPVVAT